jgi:hypothetical protein
MPGPYTAGYITLLLLEKLPIELTLSVLETLPAREVARLRGVNRHFRNIIDAHPNGLVTPAAANTLTVEQALESTQQFSNATRTEVIQNFINHAASARFDGTPEDRAEIFQASARYGTNEQRQAIMTAATPAALSWNIEGQQHPDPTLRANVLATVAEYGTHEQRESVYTQLRQFENAEDRARLYVGLAMNGSDFMRRRVQHLAGADAGLDGGDGLREWTFAVAGNDQHRDAILGHLSRMQFRTANGELADNVPHEHILAAALEGAAGRGNYGHREQVLSLLRREGVQAALNPLHQQDFHIARILNAVAARATPDQLQSIVNFATPQHIPDDGQRRRVLLAAIDRGGPAVRDQILKRASEFFSDPREQEALRWAAVGQTATELGNHLATMEATQHSRDGAEHLTARDGVRTMIFTAQNRENRGVEAYALGWMRSELQSPSRNQSFESSSLRLQMLNEVRDLVRNDVATLDRHEGIWSENDPSPSPYRQSVLMEQEAILREAASGRNPGNRNPYDRGQPGGASRGPGGR